MRFFSSPYNRSLMILVFSVISLLGLLLWALGNAVQVLASIGSGPTVSNVGEIASTFIGLGLCALLFIPLIVDSARALRGESLPTLTLPPLKWKAFLLLALAWGGVTLLASVLSFLGDLGPLLAAPFAVAGIAISTLTFAWLGAGGLARGSRRRLLSALGFSISGSSLIAIVLQYIPLILVVLVVGVMAAFDPQLLNAIEQLQIQVDNARDVEELLNLLAPYLMNPAILAALLVFAAGVAPLSEELVKPLAVWLLGRRLHSPAEGFALGALGGAGFAIIEGFLGSGMFLETPYFGLPARLASSLMHVTLSAIMGWGIASAFLRRRWGHLLGAYALSVTLHGLWNGSAVLAVYGSLHIILQEAHPFDPLGLLSMMLGAGVIFIIFVGVALALPLINQRLRRDIIPPAFPLERTSDGLDSQSN